MKKDNSAAFTLVELLIATAIFSVVALSLYSAFQTGILSYKRVDSAFNVFQTARILLNRLELDLKNAFVYAETDSKFSGSGSTLNFFSLIDSYEKDNICTNVCRVKYDLDGNVLKRTCFYGLQALNDNPEPKGEELSTDVKEISFYYAFATGNPDNPDEWQDSWPKAGDANQKKSLPLAVKIILSVIQRDKNKKETGVIEFSRIIPLPLGRRVLRR